MNLLSPLRPRTVNNSYALTNSTTTPIPTITISFYEGQLLLHFWVKSSSNTGTDLTLSATQYDYVDLINSYLEDPEVFLRMHFNYTGPVSGTGEDISAARTLTLADLL